MLHHINFVVLIITHGGSDRIRTGDLFLDREICWATTPRSHEIPSQESDLLVHMVHESCPFRGPQAVGVRLNASLCSEVSKVGTGLMRPTLTNGAARGIRTPNRNFTKVLLCH